MEGNLEHKVGSHSLRCNSSSQVHSEGDLLNAEKIRRGCLCHGLMFEPDVVYRLKISPKQKLIQLCKKNVGQVVDFSFATCVERCPICNFVFCPKMPCHAMQPSPYTTRLCCLSSEDIRVTGIQDSHCGASEQFSACGTEFNLRRIVSK